MGAEARQASDGGRRTARLGHCVGHHDRHWVLRVPEPEALSSRVGGVCMADAIEPAARKDGHARVRTAFQRSVLAILLAFNTLLVFALLAAGGVLPVAAAQGPVRGPGNYVCVTAKSAGQSYDVLY